jgi:hypothetical protein
LLVALIGLCVAFLLIGSCGKHYDTATEKPPTPMHYANGQWVADPNYVMVNGQWTYDPVPRAKLVDPRQHFNPDADPNYHSPPRPPYQPN